MDSLVLLHSSTLMSAMEDYDHQDSVECQMKVFHFDDDVNDEILITFTNTLGNELSMGSRSNSNSSSSRFDSIPSLSSGGWENVLSRLRNKKLSILPAKTTKKKNRSN